MLCLQRHIKAETWGPSFRYPLPTQSVGSPLLEPGQALRWSVATSHPRNIDDARIHILAAAGGAVGMSTIFLSASNRGPARGAAFADLSRIGDVTPAEQAELARRWRSLD